MAGFGIYAIRAGAGELAISPIPGRDGDIARDMADLIGWEPALVLTMTTAHELTVAGVTDLPTRLHEAGVKWLHLPVEDFGAPVGETAAYWPVAAKQALGVLDAGGRVLIHCFGGQGRSGMAALRLLVDLGEDGATALRRLRTVRPGAVETEEQRRWAVGG